MSRHGGTTGAVAARAAQRRCARVLAAVLVFAPFGAGAAPTFLVNSVADVPQPPGSGTACETAPGNGICTLRAAVMAANRVPGGGATIRVPAGVYALSIPGTQGAGKETSGDLDVLQGMTIVGDGPSATILDGSALTPIFFVSHSNVSGDTRIESLTIRDGRSDSYGGGMLILDQTPPPETVLENVLVEQNQASLDGGGIEAVAHNLILQHCIIRDNVSQASGGGVFVNGGGTTVSDSFIAGNQAMGDGGGVYAAAPQLTIERSSIVGNGAAGRGGGLYAEFGSVTLVNSTFDANQAGSFGGGIGMRMGELSLLSDTVSSNVANSAHETPPSPSGSYGGGISTEEAKSATLRNTVLSENTSGVFMGGAFAPDESGPEALTSLDYVACGSPTCSLVGVLSHVTTSFPYPLLEPLTRDGGFSYGRNPAATFLHRAIPAASCVDLLGAPLAVDGRGFARTGGCDIGAVQENAPYAPPSLFGAELIRNGGAAGNELGEAVTGTRAVLVPPYWLALGEALSQAVYGAEGFPARPDAPAGSGAYLFVGGPGPEVAYLSQTIDLSAAAVAIDAGTVGYRLAGAFGGVGTEDDNASLQLRFLDATAAKIADVTIGGFRAVDRSGVTKLLPAAARGTVPYGARSVDLTLAATRTYGTYNDAFADDLSLRLPEPAGRGAAALAALLGLAARRSRARRPRASRAAPRARVPGTPRRTWQEAAAAAVLDAGAGRNRGELDATVVATFPVLGYLCSSPGRERARRIGIHSRSGGSR